MFLRIVLLCCVLVIREAAFEGEKCSNDGVDGTCVLLPNCQSAIELIKRRGRPKICDFDGSTPIVCCSGQNPVTTTTPRSLLTTITTPKVTTTTMYIPETPDYMDVDRAGGCAPIDRSLTSPRNGQKAFDKCVDYQEKYVYPCERSVALSDEQTRGRHCHHNADDLIVGGNDTHAYEFPHMVMLGYGDNEQSILWLCGGSIISEKYILTAAHCIATRDQGDVKYVLVGALTRSDANNPNNIYKVKRIIVHPDHQAPSKYHDISLLETEKKITLSQFVVPACIHVGEPVTEDTVLATGWGLREYKGSVSEIMQKVKLEKFTTQECTIKYEEHRNLLNGFDPQTQTCYGDRLVPRDTCQGDSGGPIQIKSKKLNCMYVIVGVTSFGRACGFPSEPAIYTKVSYYIPWIESIVWP